MRAQLTTLDQLVQLMDPALHAHLQAADSTNFFFFFRMLLVWYKREFAWADVLRLWEALWTDLCSSSFHLFVALAILETHRDVIMAHLQHFDEVLKYGQSYPPFLQCQTQQLTMTGRSQRALQHHRPRGDADPRREPLPALPAHGRGPRQAQPLPRADGAAAAAPAVRGRGADRVHRRGQPQRPGPRRRPRRRRGGAPAGPHHHAGAARLAEH